MFTSIFYFWVMKLRFCIVIVSGFLFSVSACSKSKDSTPPSTVDSLPASVNTFYPWTKFSIGADLSYVNEIEDNGGVYKDSGATKDPFLIFKNHGCNTVRVRLWYNPSWKDTTAGRLYSDLIDVEKTIQRARAQGMAVNLDFHYSDTWADPGNQITPYTWQGLPLTVLSDSVYQYTLRVLNELKSKNLAPEMVQVGNEINGGMLFPVGQVVNNDWTNFGVLLNSGIKAIRDFSAASSIKPKVILHVAKPENADWWEGNIISNAKVIDFDILGISYYYIWSNLTSLSQLTSTISSLKTKYGKEVMIVETNCPWTNGSADNYNNIISGNSPFAGYTISKDEQYRFMKDMTQAVIKGGGTGIMYWEPAWITSGMYDGYGKGSSYENCTLFDFSSNALPAIDFMNYTYSF